MELISIIVPVYNVEKYILNTIASVTAQTHTNWELLLIEDGSKDRTVELINNYLQESGETRIRLICLPENVGAARARNVGMEQAKGRYVTYLDSDDLWEPVKLEHELAFMKKMEQQGQNCGFAFTGYEFADQDGVGLGKIVHVPETLCYEEALGNTTIFTSTVMFDTQKLPKEMLMMPAVKSEDTALWWQILRQGHIAYGLDENLVKYRRAGKSLSSNKLEAIRRIWMLYDREQLPVWKRLRLFVLWAFRAVKRRII